MRVLCPGWIGIEFLWREENRRTRRKTLRARMRTNNKLNPHMTPGPAIEPGTHWWEVSALTTAPSLLPWKRLSLRALLALPITTWDLYQIKLISISWPGLPLTFGSYVALIFTLLTTLHFFIGVPPPWPMEATSDTGSTRIFFLEMLSKFWTPWMLYWPNLFFLGSGDWEGRGEGRVELKCYDSHQYTRQVFL